MLAVQEQSYMTISVTQTPIQSDPISPDHSSAEGFCILQYAPACGMAFLLEFFFNINEQCIQQVTLIHSTLRCSLDYPESISGNYHVTSQLLGRGYSDECYQDQMCTN